MGGKVYGCATISGARVLSEAEFHELADQHLWPRDAALPYERRVCGLGLTAPRRLAEPIPYWRPPGAVGVNIFRRTAEDAPPALRSPRAAARRSARGARCREVSRAFAWRRPLNLTVKPENERWGKRRRPAARRSTTRRGEVTGPSSR